METIVYPLTIANCPIHLQLQVYQEFSQTTDRCTTSKLRLYHAQSRRYRSVWHLQYADWAEQNCPRDVNHFLDFLEELNSVRLASTHEVPPGHNTNPPVLIHCLEGGGRSGVTLTADLLLYTLDHNEVIYNIHTYLFTYVIISLLLCVAGLGYTARHRATPTSAG